MPSQHPSWPGADAPRFQASPYRTYLRACVLRPDRLSTSRRSHPEFKSTSACPNPPNRRRTNGPSVRLRPRSSIVRAVRSASTTPGRRGSPSTEARWLERARHVIRAQTHRPFPGSFSAPRQPWVRARWVTPRASSACKRWAESHLRSPAAPQMPDRWPEFRTRRATTSIAKLRSRPGDGRSRESPQPFQPKLSHDGQRSEDETTAGAGSAWSVNDRPNTRRVTSDCLCPYSAGNVLVTALTTTLGLIGPEWGNCLPGTGLPAASV